MMELLSWMMIYAPKLENTLENGRDLDSTFFSLNEGLRRQRGKLGDSRCDALLAMSDRMRAHFETDPENKTGDGQAGRDLIAKMEAMLDDLWRLESEHTGQNDN